MITILSYILVRLFVRKKNYYLEGDELRYLATGRNFYKLWNGQPYDTHPPLYSWFIRVFRSGVIVSFLCSLGLYFVCYNLYGVLGLTPLQRTIALTFLAFNYTLIYYSNRTFRYQLIALLGTLTIYLLVTHNWIAAGLSWGLLSLTCTFAGIRMSAGWFLLGMNWDALVIAVSMFILWLLEKTGYYINNEYYPSGIDGKIERVEDFTLKQLISPLYFNWSYSYYGNKELGYDFKGWFRKIGGVFGLYKPLGFLVPIALFFTIKGAIVSPLWMSAFVLILLYPSLYKRFLPRNSIIAIPIIGFLIAKGLPHIPCIWLFLGQIGVVVAFLALNRVGMLTKPKIKAQAVSRYLDTLPKNGVLVEGLIAYPIAYNSRKRVVVLPRDPDFDNALNQIILSKREFQLNYCVISEAWRKEELGYPAIDYIKLHKLIHRIVEDEDTYYVYEL